jgi:hypothetical protein
MSMNGHGALLYSSWMTYKELLCSSMVMLHYVIHEVSCHIVMFLNGYDALWHE